MDYSLPGSSIHGIFQARVLEWGAIDSKHRKMLREMRKIFFKSHHIWKKGESALTGKSRNKEKSKMG